MENPQAQMQQGQAGPSPEQMQQMQQGAPQEAPQGQPQQGGQDPQMEQVMQLVQQMMQQGVQPVEAAAELLSKQVPPEIVMQVFVQLGMPEQDAQAAIEQAMQGGQQPQGQGEQEMEGSQEEEGENENEDEQEGQSMMPPGMEQPQMAFGGIFSGNTARRLKNKKNVVINNYNINGEPQEDETYMGGAGYAPDAEEDVYYNPGLRTSAGNAMFPNNGNASTPPMKNGGMLKRYQNGAAVDPNQELQTVMQQVQDMMSQGSDARQVMEKIQAAVQQGQISPEVGASVMEQLGGMQQATDPQGSDVAMTDGSQDPQAMDPNVAAPEAQMLKFGGNLKKLMSRAYGGPAVAPGTDSKTYAKDRTSMFVNAVKNSAFKSTLDDEFPSLGGNKMAYGGNLPKAVDGFDVTKYKTADEAELAAYRYKQGLSPEEQAKFDVTSTLKTWKEPEFKPESGKQYELDQTTGKLKVVAPKNQFQFAEGDVMGQDAQGSYVTRKDGTMQRLPSMQNQGAQSSYSQINPVAYQNPINNGFWGNIAASASPFGRMVAGIGTNNMYDPRITGANLPGGMSGAQFLGAIGQNGLVPGMAGNVAGQNWRVGEAEKFKEGSIWKGNRRKGVRYQIDWGTQGPPAGPENKPTSPTQIGIANNPSVPYSGYADETGLSPAPAGTEMTTDANGNPIAISPDEAARRRNAWQTKGTQPANTVSFNQSNQPSASVVANQSTVAPGASTVVNPASEVNATDQNAQEQFPSLIPGSNEMISKEALDFQKNQAARGLEWNGQNWGPNKQMRDVATMLNPNATKSQDVSGVANATASGTANYADSNPRSSAPDQPVTATVDNSAPSPSDLRQDKRAIKKENRQKTRAMRNMANDNADQNQMPEVMQQAFQQQSYGGNVDPAALQNAIALINRAFGGMIPKAVNGIDLGTEDTDVNKIPDYLQAENLPANQPNPFDKSGNIEQSAGKKLDINWNQVGSAAGDMYMNAASKVTNFANKMNAIDPERDMAKLSALNRPSNTYDTMKQGLYDQAGNFIPNDIGNQVLNPTDTYYNNQRQIFAYGGKVYEIGGEVDLDDNEMEQLAAAGFKLSRM